MSPSAVEENFDSTASDRTSFNALGTEARWWAKVDFVICMTFTTTSLVWLDELDCACGSEIGVDDHAAKFHLAAESTVCSCM